MNESENKYAKWKKSDQSKLHISIHQFKTIENENKSERICRFLNRAMVQGEARWAKVFSRIWRYNFMAACVPWMWKALASIKKKKEQKQQKWQHTNMSNMLWQWIYSLLRSWWWFQGCICTLRHILKYMQFIAFSIMSKYKTANTIYEKKWLNVPDSKFSLVFLAIKIVSSVSNRTKNGVSRKWTKCRMAGWQGWKLDLVPAPRAG